MTKDFEGWLLYLTSTNILRYLLLVLMAFLVISVMRRLLKKHIADNAVKYKSQKAIEVLGYLFILLISIFYFSGNIQDFGLAMGLLTAGVTITLQELILSITGSLYIFIVKVYHPGDRIEINGIKGDVIDIDSIYTTMMEIGEWVSSDNYSGRIVKISNAFVFKGPVYNYSKDFPFVWDEITLPIRYDSDIDLAKSIISAVAQEQLSDYVEESILKWKDVVDKYYIEDAQVNPTLALTMTDNWLQFNLRFIVDYKKRRHTKHLLHQEIGRRIAQTDGRVALASATFEVVSIPTLKMEREEPTAME